MRPGFFLSGNPEKETLPERHRQTPQHRQIRSGKQTGKQIGESRRHHRLRDFFSAVRSARRDSEKQTEI